MSKKDAIAAAGPKTKNTTRLVICDEVFDCQAGEQFIAVYHPVSKLNFMVAPELSRLKEQLTAHSLEIKRAIWTRYNELSQTAQVAQQLQFEGAA